MGFIFTGVFFLPCHKCMHTTVFCPDLNLPRQGCVGNIAVVDLSTFDCDESKLGSTIFVMVAFLAYFPLFPPMYINKSEHLPKTLFLAKFYIYILPVVQFLLELNGLHVYMFETNAVVLIALPYCDNKVLYGFGHSRHIDQFALVFACMSLSLSLSSYLGSFIAPNVYKCDFRHWNSGIFQLCCCQDLNSQSHLLRTCALPYFGRLDELSHLQHLMTAFSL